MTQDPGPLLTGLCQEIMSDLVTYQLLLSEAQVRGYVPLASVPVREYERFQHGREEEVRQSLRTEPLTGEAVHEHLGMPHFPDGEAEGMLDAYKQHEYIPVNRYLRLGYKDYAERLKAMGVWQPNSEKSLKGETAALDRVFAAAPATDRPMVVYRGMRGFLPERTPPGTVIHDGAYMSTTTDPAVASRFARMTDSPNQKLVRITVPAGAHAVSVEKHREAFGADDEEHEVLLERGHSLRVTGVHGDTIEAELIPGENPSESPAERPAAPSSAASSRAALLAKAAAYKAAQGKVALSSTGPDRSRRFVWEPGDIKITRPMAEEGR